MNAKYDEIDKARFWSKVETALMDDLCWDWSGQSDGTGYGIFMLRDQTFAASHRLAFAFASSLPLSAIEGLIVRHACDRPKCCNPFHLSTGTHADNVMDRVLRQRSAKGTGNGNHVLTEAQVRAVMKDPRSNSAIARELGVHTDTVRNIKIGKTWTHLFTETPAEPLEVTDSSALVAPTTET